MRRRTLKRVFYGIVLSCAAVFLHISYATRTTFRSACITGAEHKIELVLQALMEYYDDNGRLPSRVTTYAIKDKEYMHSWRAMILPYITTKDLLSVYSVSEPHDSAANIAGAPAIRVFSAVSGLEDACVFMISDSSPLTASGLEGRVIVVSIPFERGRWTSLKDVTSDHVWKVVSGDPEIVFVGLFGGCVIRLADYVKTYDECVAFLTNMQDHSGTARVVHERIIASRTLDSRNKRCSEKWLQNRRAGTGEKSN